MTGSQKNGNQFGLEKTAVVRESKEAMIVLVGTLVEGVAGASAIVDARAIRIEVQLTKLMKFLGSG